MSNPSVKLSPWSKKKMSALVELEEVSIEASIDVNFPPILRSVGKNAVF